MIAVGKTSFRLSRSILSGALFLAVAVGGHTPIDGRVFGTWGTTAAVAQETETGATQEPNSGATASDVPDTSSPVTETPETGAAASTAASDAEPDATAAETNVTPSPTPSKTEETTQPTVAPDTTASETTTQPVTEAVSNTPSATTAETTPKPAPERVPKPPTELRIATWTGAYAEAQKKAVFDPFSRDAGIKISALPHTGGSSLLDANKLEANKWDIADVPFHVAQMACEKGLIQKIDPAELRDANGAPIDLSDFIEGAVSPCAIGTNIWSSVIAFDSNRFAGRQPSRIEDFFDVQGYPGRRGLPMRPRYVLEMALMADGVSPDKIYETLATDAGAARALAKLESIRKSIVWWQSAREPATLLMEKKVTMAVGFNGRFYMATAARDAGIELLWDGQIYDLDVLVVPKATQHMPTAMKFLSFAVRPKTMAAQASWLPYGPSRRSAAALVNRHASLPLVLTNYLPTAKGHLARAMRTDEAWWDRENPRLIELFRNWLDGKAADEPGDAAAPSEAPAAD